MRNKKNTLYIILAVIVVIVGIVILSKDNSKDKKDETETTKTEQTTEVKKATEQPTVSGKENTRTTAEATDQQNQIPSSTQQAVTTTEKQKPRAFYGIWCDAYKKRTIVVQLSRQKSKTFIMN